MNLVLIVDDAAYERRLAREVVQREGCAFAEAENGREALELIDELHPHCIFSDLVMPEMDGIELLTRLQARGDSIPVIVLTSDCQPETCEDCCRLGAVTVLSKPWDPDVLAETLRGVLRA